MGKKRSKTGSFPAKGILQGFPVSRAVGSRENGIRLSSEIGWVGKIRYVKLN